MPDMSPVQVKMPELPADVRIAGFGEVALGYDEDMAAKEAARCLGCKNRPCVDGCPVGINIPEFVGLIARRDFDGAFESVRAANALPAICGRVCPQETQCERLCVRGIKGESVAIGKLERFVADRRISAAARGGADKTNVSFPNSTDVSFPDKTNVSFPDSTNVSPANDTNVSYPDDTLNRPSGSQPAAQARSTAQRVAVVGSGPASLTCAGNLAKMGYRVKIFESFHVAGGVLTYGIPEFRLPKKLVRQEIDLLLADGVEIEFDVVVGKTVGIDDLFRDGYDAVFIGAGAGLPQFLKIPGENLCGVYTANEFLTRVNLMRAYMFPETDTPVKRGKNVAVFGGGNVALDAARCAKRLGADNVYIVYRRSAREMPARAEEVCHAGEEGIVFQFLTNPKRLLGDQNGWVNGVECYKMELGEPDASGRRRPIAVEGSEFVIDIDLAIIAIGQTPNPIIREATPALKCEPWGGIIADENTCATSVEGVYAGGDIVTGAATVILAMGAGKTAAASIDKYLRGRR